MKHLLILPSPSGGASPTSTEAIVGGAIIANEESEEWVLAEVALVLRLLQRL